LTLDARAHGRRIPARHRRGAADHDPRADPQLRVHRVADRAGGVVVVDVDALGARHGERSDPTRNNVTHDIFLSI